MSDCRLPDYRRRKNFSKSTRSISGRDEYTIGRCFFRGFFI